MQCNLVQFNQYFRQRNYNLDESVQILVKNVKSCSEDALMNFIWKLHSDDSFANNLIKAGLISELLATPSEPALAAAVRLLYGQHGEDFIEELR